MTASMTEQRKTFDGVADLYAKTRPGVPLAAVDALWAFLDLPEAGAVLEVGCGTGQLTGHLLERGARVTAIDPGAALAATCERELGCDALTVEVATFEDWQARGRHFAAVVACQAAHWIDPVTFLDRALAVLTPQGCIGFLWHVDRSEQTPFWKATEPIYERYLPDVGEKPPRTIPKHIDAYEAAIREERRLSSAERSVFAWTRRFDAAGYIALLETNSPVRMLDQDKRAEFLEGHRRVLDDFGGEVTRHYETVLLTTRVGGGLQS